VLGQGRGIEDVRDWAVSQLPLGPRLYPKVHAHKLGLALQQVLCPSRSCIQT